jgi:N-acetylated-alpha-linked acidic dipeptidase
MAIFKQAAVCAVTAAAVVQACLRERDFFLSEQPIARRQDAVAFPPVLDENESILVNSFDRTSLATWSYYYTHGLHVAGTNRTMAQYTADRWNENGFTAGLAEYCTQVTCTSSEGELR